MIGKPMSKGVSLSALIVGVCLAMAASSGALAKPGGGGGKGGNSGGDDIPLDVTFQCSAGDCALAEDGGGTYSDGQDRVTALLTSSGHINFGVGARKKRAPLRNLFWDFSQGGTELVTSGGTYQTSDDITDIYGSKIQVNRRGDLDLRTMAADGTANNVDWWGDITIFDSGSPTIVSHRLDAAGAQDECTGFATNDATLRKTSDTTWVVGIPDLELSCTLVQDPDDPNGNLREEQFQVGPFEIVFEAQP